VEDWRPAWLICGLFGERLLFRKQDFKGVLQTRGSEPLAEGREVSGGRDRTRTCDLLRVKKPCNPQWIHHLLGFS
jgi:hypothetical protein